MKMRSLFSVIAALSLAMPAMVGCEDTIESERKVEVKDDGTVVTEEKKVTEQSDGSIKKTEEKTVDRPNDPPSD